ncbi:MULTISPECIES: class I SAM-dependent methyltransferase [unclassified Methylobacterium]|nr:methyltransferase domain-containing protein [Methylobacterium sp. 4-46]
MRDADAVFTGSIPALYDGGLGPVLFAPYARDVAARVAAFAPASVLETAAGTGIVTRALVAALPPGTPVLATDLNQAMLDHAAAQPGAAGVTWRQADAQALPVPDAAFDAVVCQFGAMFFPDRRAAFAQARRVLRPGGRFVLTVWDRLAENDLAATVTQALAALFPADPPAFLARTPYGLHDPEAVRGDLLAAGFSSVTVETVPQVSDGVPARAAAGMCQGTPLRGEIEARGA